MINVGDQEILQTINDNVIKLQSQCSEMTGEMVGFRDGLGECKGHNKHIDGRLRKVENLMLPVGTVLAGIIIYVIVASVGV